MSPSQPERRRRKGFDYTTLVVAGMALAGTLYTSSCGADIKMEPRVKALEQHQDEHDRVIEQRLERMERQIGQLVEWALGTPR